MYNKYKLWMLRAACKSRGLSTHGTRKDLIKRLEKADIDYHSRAWDIISGGSNES